MSIFKKHSRKDVVRAIEAHEVGPYKDTKEGWPYIFTGVSRKKDPSSAFGPRQITYSTIANALDAYKEKGNKLSPELQAYADKLVAQGKNKVNLDQGAAKFYSEAGIGIQREATAEDRASFGSFGTGFIPRKDHEKYYDKIADIVFDEKLREAKALGVTDKDGFLRVYHGSTDPEKNLDYQDKVNRYLDDPSLIDRKPGLFGMGMVIPGTRIGFDEGGDVPSSEQTDKLLSKENVKDAAMFGAEFIPGVGEALAIKRTSDALDKKDYVGAGIEATAGLLGIIPGVGDLAGKGLRTATKAFRKADVEEAEKIIDNPDLLKKWEKENTLPESQRQKNIPEAEKAAEDLYQGEITSKEARTRIKEAFPEPELYTANTMPEMPTVTEVAGSMGKKALAKGIVGVKGFDLEAGQRLGARLDIPAYNRFNKWVVSIHDGNSSKGRVVGYGQAIRLKNIKFGSDPKIALNIARGKTFSPKEGKDVPFGKSTIARVYGDYVPEDPYELQEFARKILADKDSGWTQVGMNPYRGSYFYDKSTGNLVTSADEVIQVGPLVLAKNVVGLGMDKKPTLSEVKEVLSTPVARTKDGKLRTFNVGGDVSMDPISGNDVPVGSLQKEVRDDIPAQLSEGEFVMPADVVRYHGLDKMMSLRDEAKAGLARMEARGQMGNADEATIPAGVPFNIDDLIMDDEPVEMQVGGFVPQVNNQPLPTGFVTPPQQQFISPYAIAEKPTYAPVGEQPTFEQLMPTTSGTYTEIRTYVNDAGLIMNIPFVNGQPLYPIPAGYRLQTGVQTTPSQEAATVAAPAVQQEQRDDSDSNREIDEYNEQLRQQMLDKKEAARKLGYTKEQSTLDALLTMNPILRALSGNPERGTILANGNIADGEGGSFDPVTGKQAGFLGTTNLGKDDFKVTQEMFEAGITPASLAGLRNLAGDESIRDVIEGLSKVTTTPETTDVATQMDAITRRPDMLDTQPAAPLPVYDAEVRRVPFSEIGKDFRGGMERYDAPTVEVTAEPTEIATINRFGKLTDYQKVGDDYFRVKEDGTLSSAPASGLTRANLINPDSPIVDRTEVGGEPTEDRIALPVSRTDAIRQRKIDSENRAADERLAKIAREEAERQAEAAEEARKEKERIEEQNRRADERLARIAEEQRQKEIIAEQTRRQQSQTDTSEADKQSAKEGKGNIVTDRSGRPVTDSRGQAVTTTRGRERDRSTIERQADAMRREADRKESKPASKPATSAADYNRKDGGGGGGGGGNNDGCFAKGTLITMQDGSKKPVEKIDIGDEVAVGGTVFAAGRFLIDNLYDYEGIKVSGTHMVNEDGLWTRVQDSKKAKFESDDDVVVYIFGSENRRIVINDILFTDYFEVTEQEKLKEVGDSYFTTWKEHAIIDSEDNVKIRNLNNDTTTIMAAE